LEHFGFEDFRVRDVQSLSSWKYFKTGRTLKSEIFCSQAFLDRDTQPTCIHVVFYVLQTIHILYKVKEKQSSVILNNVQVLQVGRPPRTALSPKEFHGRQ
jgi:hypothetical protein